MKTSVILAALALSGVASFAQAAPAATPEVIHLEKVMVIGHRADLARPTVRLEPVTVIAHRSDERLAQSHLVRASAPLITGHHGSI